MKGFTIMDIFVLTASQFNHYRSEDKEFLQKCKIIDVSEDGNFLEESDNNLKIFVTDNITQEQVNQIKNFIENNKDNPIGIFYHGGLSKGYALGYVLDKYYNYGVDNDYFNLMSPQILPNLETMINIKPLIFNETSYQIIFNALDDEGNENLYII